MLDEYVAEYVKTADANDILYAIEASYGYDPAPGLDRIKHGTHPKASVWKQHLVELLRATDG